ncbi:MAG: carboxypeptidase regulatory-like domain-containing protein, partial [Nitrospirae bacterium]|nr:carboxypeptidase regulatory-like domain-containing protein [Nitrospirota bacterium]
MSFATAEALELTHDDAVPCFPVSLRMKSGKVQITWTTIGAQAIYRIYRAQESAPSTFTKIADTTSTYSTYLDTSVVNEITYLYIVEAVRNGNICYSNVVSIHPTTRRTPPNYNPVIYSTPLTTGTSGIMYVYNVDATDPNKNIVTYSLTVKPDGMTIDPATGVIQWVPPAFGLFDVTVNASDGKGGTVSQSFNITVQSPDADGDGYTVTGGDCDDNDPAVHPGAAELCNNIDDNCDTHKDEGLGQTSCGTGSCFHSVDNCVNGQTQTCDPMAGASSEICDGQDNDCDGVIDNGVLNACGGCGVVPAEVCDGRDNDCDGQKDEGFDADSDKFTICGGDCNDNDPAINPAAFEIPNNGIDEDCSGGDLVARPPQITVPDTFEVDEGGTLEFNVTASDPDGDAVTLSASPKISNSGFAAINGVSASGAYSFNPGHSQQGIYNVTFTATDPLGYKGNKTVTITVNNVNRAPGLIVEPQWNIKEGEVLAIPVQASDPDNDILSVRAFVQPEEPDKPLPDNAMFIESTGTLTFTPEYTQAGVYDIVFEASDGELSSGPQTAHIIIDDVPDADVPGELILNVDHVESPTLLKTLRVTGSVNASSTPPQIPVRSVLITGMDPTTGQQGATLNVTLTGESSGRYATHFEQGKSRADFGDGITVNSLTVNSPAELVVNITIDPSAAEGTRSVMVTTDKEVAVSVLAFSVTQGASETTGSLTDNETGQPLAGAIVTIQGTNITTITNPDGSFTLSNVPPGNYTLLINAPDHDLITIDFDSQVGAIVDLGDIKPQANVFNPEAPPAATVFSIVGRGAGDVSFENSTVEEVEKLVVDTIIAVGGNEAGVLDEYGNQLNPNVTGDGIVSLRHRGMQNLAKNLITGDSRSLGEILTLFLRSFDYKGQPVPKLMDVLSAIQQEVDSSWSNPRDGSPLIMALFNQKRSLLGDPPKVRLDTNLNSLQTYLLVTSLMTFVHNQVTAAPPSGMLQNNLFAFADTTLNDSAFDASPFLFAQSGPGNGGSGSGSGAYSIIWETVFDTAKAGFIDNLKSKGIEICKKLTDVKPSTCGDGQVQAGEDCDGTPGCAANCQFAIKPSPPGCKETSELAMILIDDMGDAATGASEKFGQFFMSEGATNLTAQRIQQEYQSESFKKAWTESKKEAQSMGKLTKLVEFSSNFIQDQLNNVQGAIIGSILDLQTELIIESLRPDPPLIKKIEQMRDPSNGELSTTVKITFQRSQKDDANTDGIHRWFYELWREQKGRVARITSGSVRTPEKGPGPRPTEDPRTLVFYDVDAPEGSVLYRIRSVRMIGTIVADEPPNVIDTIFQMASGFVPLNFATPGGTTVMGGDTLKMLLDPAAKIMQGIKIQKSEFSDVQPIFVSLKERPPSPPANLAVDPHKGVTYMSIPALSRIFKVNDGDISDFANAGFKAPYQIGLGIDSTGNLYTDNAASDMQFGGRIFKFDGNTTARS